jgi:hypothetical protein
MLLPLGGLIRAVIISVFIIVMAALTAVAVLATKIVELYSAIHKHKRETPTPTPITTTSAPSQTTARRVSFRDVVDLVLIWSSKILSWLRP